MNGLDLLVKLGVPETLVAQPEGWLSLSNEQAFRRLIDEPLQQVVLQGATSDRITLLDDKSGILKGISLFEVILYRDVSKALPLAKDVEASGEEAQPQFFSSSRTLKILLTDGTDRTFVAMEYEPCSALNDVKIGSKLQLINCYYHMGILLLTPDTAKLVSSPTKVSENQ
jgi:hypothetical protein